MTKWTKGPWKVGDPYSPTVALNHVSVRADNDFIVAAVNRFAASFGDKTDEANAHLIAAAPELYEAVEALLPDCYFGTDENGDKTCNYCLLHGEHKLDCMVGTAELVLAKARGEQ